MAGYEPDKLEKGLIRVKNDLSEIRQGMRALGQQLRAAGTEINEENLSKINRELRKTIQQQKDQDYPFKILLLTKKLETEREKSMLTKQKLVGNQTLSIFFKECFDISTDMAPTMTLRNAMEIMKSIQRQWEKEKNFLTKSVQDLHEEVNALRDENRSLKEEEMAGSLSSQVVIDSLEETLKEQRKEMEAEIRRFQKEVDVSKKREAEQTLRMSEMEQELRSMKEELPESKAKMAAKEEANAMLKKKVEDLQEEIIKLEERALKASEIFEEFKNEVHECDSRAIQSDAKCFELAKKLDESYQCQLSMLQRLSEGDKIAQKLNIKNMTLSNDVEVMEQQLKEAKERLEEANDSCKTASSDLQEMTSTMNWWKTKAHQLETIIAATKAKSHKMENEKKKLLKTMIEEFNKHLNHSLSMKSEMACLQRNNQEQGNEINALESKNIVLVQNLEESQKQGAEQKNLKSKAEEDLRVMRDENAKLNDVINQLEQRLHMKKNRRWWKRLVSCS